MFERYTRRTLGPFDFPLTSLGGKSDTSVTDSELQAWAALSSKIVTAAGRIGHSSSNKASPATPAAPFRLQMFEGGHFYLMEDECSCSGVLACVTDSLSAAMNALAPAIICGPTEVLTCPAMQLCVHELFFAQAERTPDALAVVGLERELTYTALVAEVVMLARELQMRGLERAERVGIYLPHHEDYIVANLAVFAAGGAIFLLETNYTTNLLGELIETGGIRTVLTTAAMRQKLPAAHREKAYLLGSGWFEALRIKDATEATSKSTAAESPIVRLPPLRDPGVNPQSQAYITMTSGSTGKPKAILNNHAAAVLCFEARQRVWPYAPGEREGLNVFFAWECLRAVIYGATAVVIPDDIIFDPPRLLRFVRERAITRLMITPSLMQALLDFPGLDHKALMAHMRLWFLEGEVVPMRVVHDFCARASPGVALVNAYSTWESVDVSYADLTDPKTRVRNTVSKFAPCGTAMPGVQIYVVDEAQQIVKRGLPGEVFIGSPGVATAYLGDPAKTRARFLPNPFGPQLATLLQSPPHHHGRDTVVGDPASHAARVYRTGDRGVVRDDGQLLLLGRIDSTVKIRGFKVSLLMVEHTLAEVDGVGPHAVEPQRDEVTGQPKSLAAYICGEGAAMPNRDVLVRALEHCRARLPEYAVPTYFVPLDKLPMKGGESRKLDRQRLPTPAPEHRLAGAGGGISESGESAHATFGDPVADALVSSSSNGGRSGGSDGSNTSSELELVLSATMARVLNKPHVRPKDNFFEVGGHSLAAASFVGELSQLGINLVIMDLYQCLFSVAQQCLAKALQLGFQQS
eukprot:UC1_evm1s1937